MAIYADDQFAGAAFSYTNSEALFLNTIDFCKRNVDTNPTHLITILSLDNNLSPYATGVIERTRQGTISNPDARATILLDRLGDGNTEVVHIASGVVVTYTDPIPWQPGADELDTASPDVIADFINWARDQHPDHRAVVALVGHGVGPAPEVHRPPVRRFGPLSQLPPMPQERDRTPADVTSDSYLSTPELGRALAAATDDGADPLSLLFLDSCFEGNLDVLYEVRNAAEVLVASPNYAWAAFAYDRYLPHFTITATVESMAQAIAAEYQAALDITHPHAIVWMRGDDVEPIGDAVSDLGDALRATLPISGHRSLVLNATLNSQFADTTLCTGDLELCPPDELVDARSLAQNIQAQFDSVDQAVYDAAGNLLTTLAAVHSRFTDGNPWVKSEVAWTFNNPALTILAPLTPTISAGVAWRASVYTGTVLSNVQVQGITQTVSITRPFTYAAEGRWSRFLWAWYEPLTPTVGQLCHEMPPLQDQVVTPTVAITLGAESGYANVELQWNVSNSPDVNEYRVTRALSGTQAFEHIAAVADTHYFDADPALVSGETYCYRVEGLYPGGSSATTSNVACAVFGRVELWMPYTRIAPDETGIVLVNIRNAQGLRLAATDIWLSYDGSVIQPVVISSTALTSDYAWAYTITSTESYSQVKIVAASAAAPTLYGDGALFWIAFHVVGTQDMTSTLDLRDYVSGVGGSTIYAPGPGIPPTPVFVPLALDDGTLYADCHHSLGDVADVAHSECLVDSGDAYLALWFVANPQHSPGVWQLYAGDINGNGELDTGDVTMILYYALHGRWPVPGSGVRSFHAPNANPIVLSLDEVSGPPGGTVRASLRAEELYDWAGGEFAIAYDLRLVAGITNVQTAELADGFQVEFYDDGAGLLRIAIAQGAQDPGGSGEVLTFDIQLASNAPAGALASLTLLEARLNDVYGRDFGTSVLQRTISRHNGAVHIVQRVYLPLILRNS